MPGGAPVLSADGLAIRAGERRLLEASDFALHEGERVLLVGASGAGKSLIADLLLGFAGPATPGLQVDGSLRLDGEELLGGDPETRDARIGAVFQLQRSGLFDDLTIAQNLRFGSSDTTSRAQIAERLNLEELDRPITVCSGGEGMRVAIGRTLLRGAGVIVYDEPTTGLDPVNVQQVVQAINESHRRLTLIITHDYEAFTDMVDVVLVIDPVEHRIRKLPPGPETVATLHDLLERAKTRATETIPRPPALPRRLAAWWAQLATGTAEVLLDWVHLILVPLAFLRIGHALDGPRLRSALRRDLAPGVAAFVGLSAMLTAVTGTYFLFERLPKREWTEPLVQEDLIAGLGLIYIRVGIPLMVSILLAAKLGAAAAAHLGHMSLTRQIDALQLLRVPLRRHLLLPTAAGQLAAGLLFSALAAGLSYLTSLVVFLWGHPGFSARYFHAAFVQEIAKGDLPWIVGKVGVSAIGVAAIAYRVAIAPKRSPEQVVKGIHRTLLRGLLLVLAVHALFAFLEF